MLAGFLCNAWRELRLFGGCLRAVLLAMDASRRSRRAGLAMLAATAAMILLTTGVHAWQRVATGSVDVPPFLHLGVDGSLPEIVNYIHGTIAAAALMAIYLRTRARVFLAWSIAFGFIVLDDALRYHETFGRVLVAAFDLPAIGRLRPQDTGEMLAWSLAGILLAVPLVLSVFQNRPRARGYAHCILLCVLMLMFFGVAFDMIHVATFSWWFGYAEDAGEMLAVALAASFALAMAWSPAILAEIAAREPGPVDLLAWFRPARTPAE